MDLSAATINPVRTLEIIATLFDCHSRVKMVNSPYFRGLRRDYSDSLRSNESLYVGTGFAGAPYVNPHKCCPKTDQNHDSRVRIKGVKCCGGN